MWLSQMLSTVPTLAPSQLPCGVTCVSIRSRMPISMMMPSSSGRLLTCSLVMVWGGGVMPQAYHSTARTWHPKYANHKLIARSNDGNEAAPIHQRTDRSDCRTLPYAVLSVRRAGDPRECPRAPSGVCLGGGLPGILCGQSHAKPIHPKDSTGRGVECRL